MVHRNIDCNENLVFPPLHKQKHAYTHTHSIQIFHCKILKNRLKCNVSNDLCLHIVSKMCAAYAQNSKKGHPFGKTQSTANCSYNSKLANIMVTNHNYPSGLQLIASFCFRFFSSSIEYECIHNIRRVFFFK